MGSALKVPVSTDARRGLFRRRIIAVAAPGAVRAAIEDDFHHFELVLRHDGRTVTAIESCSVRTPWTLCPSAGDQLGKLIGQPLGTDIYRRTCLPDVREQCTHQFELAKFAIAQAARAGQRQYEVTVPDRQGCTTHVFTRPDGKIDVSSRALDGRTHPELRRDGKVMLAWDVEGEMIISPDPFTGRTLRALGKWAVTQAVCGHFDDDFLEAVTVLRRAVHIASGRIVPLDTIPRADFHPPQIGACYVLQPERAATALRVIGATHDFSARPEALLSDFPPLLGPLDETHD